MTGSGRWNERVARRVRAARKRRGWTVAELADRLEWPESTLSNLEAAQWGWKLARVIEVAQALELHPSDLLTDEPQPEPPRRAWRWGRTTQ